MILVSLLFINISGSHGDIQNQKTLQGTPVVPNASLVTAEVLKYSILNSKLLNIDPEQTLYSLTLEVLASKQVDQTTPNLVKVGDIIETFSKEELSPTLFGQTIKAIVRLAGDEWGQRYWIREISVPPRRGRR